MIIMVALVTPPPPPPPPPGYSDLVWTGSMAQAWKPLTTFKGQFSKEGTSWGEGGY